MERSIKRMRAGECLFPTFEGLSHLDVDLRRLVLVYAVIDRASWNKTCFLVADFFLAAMASKKSTSRELSSTAGASLLADAAVRRTRTFLVLSTSKSISD